jgi:peroxiredoxin
MPGIMTQSQGNGTISQRTRSIVLGVVAATLVVTAAIWLLTGGDDDTPGLGMIDDGRPEVGAPAPDFALLDVRDESTVRRLSDYRGSVVILNWYATWCSPCQQEIPDFQQAYNGLKGDLVVLAVNLEESPADAAGMLEDLGATFPSVVDSAGEVYRRYGGLGMPFTLFIDRDGRVFSMGSGVITEDSLRAELAKLGLEYPES